MIFVSSHARQGGAERSLMTLLSALSTRWVAQVVCLGQGPFVDELRRRGFPTAVLPTGAGGFSIARSALHLRRLLRRTPSSVVHANGIKAALVSVLAALGTGSSVIWMKHDYSWDGPLANFLASRCVAVVGVSRAVTEALPSRLRRRVHVVHNALAAVVPERETAAERLRTLLEMESAGPIVTLVGRLDPSAEALLRKAGHRFKPENELRPFVAAAAELLKTAREVPYGSLKLEYMQSFAPRAK